MKINLRPFFSLRPILVGLALFGLMWMVMREVNLRDDYFNGRTGTHIFPGLYYEHILLALMLVVASLALLRNRAWSYVVAIFLAGLVLYDCLFRLWMLAELAEVPRYSYSHFEIWLRLARDQILRLTLASVILCCSIVSLIRLVVSRNKRTMSNNSFNRSAN